MAAYHREHHNNMDSHMNFRMLAADKALVEAAASLMGLKPQTYARQKLVEIAKKEIAEMSLSSTLVLDNESWQQFMDIMEAPIVINKNLKDAVGMLKKNDTTF